MASLSVVVVNPVKAKIEELELDVSIRESHTFDNEVTQYPVETGGTITDHIVNKPDQLSIEGFVTNSPVRIVEQSSTSRAGDRSDRVLVALDVLRRIRSEKEIVTVVTGLQTYTDMALVKLSIPRDSGRGNALWFTADFTKIQFVKSQTVAISNVKDINGAKTQAAPIQDNGRKSTTDPSTQQADSGTFLYNQLLRTQ